MQVLMELLLSVVVLADQVGGWLVEERRERVRIIMT